MCRSSLLLGRNVRWPRRMLPAGESRWVCRRDRQTDGQTNGRQTRYAATVANHAWPGTGAVRRRRRPRPGHGALHLCFYMYRQIGTFVYAYKWRGTCNKNERMTCFVEFAGFVVEYISHPVVNSFTTASAFTIAEAQFKVFNYDKTSS